MNENLKAKKWPTRTALLGLLILPWSIALFCTLWILIAHSSTPALETNSPTQWPETIEIARNKNDSTLLVFIHPKCPCTTATLSELERLLAEVNKHVCPIFVIGCPKRQQAEWMSSTITNRCYSMEGAKVVIDSDSELATKFKANTSGYCLLYSEQGRLLFQGGVTASRGHEGESLGRIALRELLSGHAASIEQAPVFGCDLVQRRQERF